MSVFCRHNRFTADCPICSKGTVLDESAPKKRAPSAGGGRSSSTSRSRQPGAAVTAEKRVFAGPHVDSPGLMDPDGARYVVRLERVPGGVRLAEWSGPELRRRAPILPAGALAGLASDCSPALNAPDAEALAAALEASVAESPDGSPGVSKGRSGDFKEELRVEGVEDGQLRVARWVLRPNQGWQLQEAAPMLPAKRFAEAIAGAVRSGLISRATVGS